MIQTVQQSTDNPLDVSVPTDASAGDWEPDGARRYRLVESENIAVGDTVRLYAHCMQWADTGIHPGDPDGRNRPGVSIDEAGDRGGWTDTGISLTASEARAAGLALFKLAGQLDHWMGSPVLPVHRFGWDRYLCTPWCDENLDRAGRGHDDYGLRADQSCWGVQRKVVLGLEDGAPALPVEEAPSDAPAISVYAYQAWHALPNVRLNLFRETDNEHTSVDVDVHVTVCEAVELAQNLLAAVAEIGGQQ